MALPDGQLRRTGLDYARVRAGLEGAGIAMTTALFDDLQVIEAGALAADLPESDWLGADWLEGGA